MERLTRRINGVVVYVGSKNPYSTGQIPCEVEPAGVREMMDRLAAYEDTGLEPATCANYKTFEDEAISKGVTFKRIVALMEADRAGRLVVLPVRPVLTQSIGSMLYIIEDGEIVEDSLCEALVGMGSNGEINIFYTTLSDQISFEQADIGKTVFLTHEEAEAALEAKSND